MGRVLGAVDVARWAVVVTPTRQALLREIGAELERQGARVEFVDSAADCPSRLTVDGLVLGPKEPQWLEWARGQRAGGALVVPAPETVERFRDRAFSHSILEASGFATSFALVGTARELLERPNNELVYPVLLKRRWHHGDPLVVLGCVEELRSSLRAAVQTTEFVIETIVQGAHTTVYFIGKKIHAFAREAFASETTETPATASFPALSASIEPLRKRSGALFGKLDLVFQDDGRVFGVDLGAFPKFLHVDGAAAGIAMLSSAALRANPLRRNEDTQNG